MTDEHPLVHLASSMPKRPITAPDGDLVYQLGRVRAESGQLAETLILGSATAEQHARLAELLRDLAQVLDVQAGTLQHREALES